MFTVVDGEDSVFNSDTLARKGDNALYDVLITEAFIVHWVFKDDYLAAIGDIWFILKLRPGNGKAVHDQAVTGIECRLHARTKHIKTSKNKGVDKECSDNNTDNKNDNI